MTPYDRDALRQLREGVKVHIAEQPTIIIPMRKPLVSDGFGGTVRNGTAEAQAACRVRLQHESGSVQKDSVGPTGLDTNLTFYVLTDYTCPLEEEDEFEALGFTWRVGKVNPLYRHGGLYKTEAPLVKGSSVPVTIPSDFEALAVSSTGIDLSWTDTGLINTYSIERKTGTESFATIATPSAGILLFHDTGLTPETTYTYRIRAYNGIAYSAYSVESSATTEAAA